MSTNVFYPCTNFKHVEQFVASRGEGIYVYDEKGKEYIEAMSGLWCLALGYGNTELINAAQEQMSRLTYGNMFGGKSHQPAIELANKLNSIAPIEDAKVFFGMSGSDANDTHIKILRYHANVMGKKKRKKILAGTKGYHGVGIGSSALTGLTAMHTNFDIDFNSHGVVRFDTPHYYRDAHHGESESEYVDRKISEMQQLINQEEPDTILALITEPLCGAGGVVPYPKGYFDKLQKLLKEHSILLIDDEVICGFGRTGEDFGATSFNLKPDAMTFAKALTSGYLPLSAALVPNAIYQSLIEESNKVGIFGHGYTYSGHPVSCAVGLKTIEIYERDGIYAKAKKTGEYLQQKLSSFKDHPLVGEVRGYGLIAALELVANKATKENFPAPVGIALLAQKKCQEAGIIVRGVAGNSVALCPPLITTLSEIDLIVERLHAGLDTTLAEVHKA